MLIIGIIIGSVVEAGLSYAFTSSQTIKLKDENEELKLQYDSLNATYNPLNSSFTWLKQHSFTYYVVDDCINISNVQIVKVPFWDDWYVNGTVTNIGSLWNRR